MYSSCSILLLIVLACGHVASAPPATQQPAQQQQQQQQQLAQDGKFAGKSCAAEKTADLSLLINETLRINNKPENAATNQSFRDDWTFDRVEYDLMDFLQELNARYKHTNKTGGEILTTTTTTTTIETAKPATADKGLAPTTASPSDVLEGKRNPSSSEKVQSSTKEAIVTVAGAARPSSDVSAPGVPLPPQPSLALAANSPVAAAAVEDNASAREISKTPEAANSAPVTVASSSVLPISLATGDHDISESTWQYGIFDRFTRPRQSTTTAQPADSLVVSSSSGATLDVRSLNSAECGLRSYRLDPDYFPQASQLDTDEITKELSQRRQRPPLGSSFFSSHKKYHHSASDPNPLDGGADLTRDDLENRDKLFPPPFDRYGEPLAAPAQHDHYQRPNYSSIDSTSAGGSLGHADPPYGGGGAGSSSNFQEGNAAAAGAHSGGEFNLSSRRQWLQQQLGSTLQLLGFNSTNPAALDEFIKQTTGSSSSAAAMSGRENMMKMSASQKLGKALAADPAAAAAASQHEQAVGIDASKLSGPEVSEQELRARQDELKLEARVIGGNDARLGDSPWSVSLQALVSRPGTGGLEYRHYCGGTIISEYYILTAAHCLDFMVGRESRLFVVMGDLNWRMSAASMHGRRFGIEKLIIHGGYKSTAFGHDIGLIRTKESMKPLKVNGRYIINSVCLPERNIEHSGEAELVGWGLFSNRNEMADSLQIADVPILPRPLCVDLYRRRTGLIQWLIGIELITEKQICAGTFGRGICQGDSGSALVFNEKVQLDGKAQRLRAGAVRDAQQRATIIGVVAFGGIRRCSYQSLPGVYMQTSKYLDWILPRIQQ